MTKRRIFPRTIPAAPRSLRAWEAHLTSCPQCVASRGPENLCYIGRALYRRVYRRLTR